MAHAYTTKRGKNKLGKLGVRKDQQQNQERELKIPTTNVHKYDGQDKTSMASIAGHLHDSATRLRLADIIAEKKAVEEEQESSTKLLICQWSECTNDSKIAGYKLMDCASCHSIKYCCRECQVGDWKNHKEACKLEKQKLKTNEALDMASILTKLQINSEKESL